MYKPDDNDIDRLSKDAAEHYHAPGEPAWDALQQILDKELPLEKEKKRRGFFFFFMLLIGLSVAGSGIWYGIKISNQKKLNTLSSNINLKNNEGINTDPVQPAAIKSAASEKNTPATNGIAAADNVSANNNKETAISKTTPPGNTIENKTTAEKNTAVHHPEPSGKKAKSTTKPEAFSVKKNKPENRIAAPAANATVDSRFKNGQPVAKNTAGVQNKHKPATMFSGKHINTGNLVKNNADTNSGKTVAGSNHTSGKRLRYPENKNESGINAGVASNIKNKRNKPNGNQLTVAIEGLPGTGNTKEADTADDSINNMNAEDRDTTSELAVQRSNKNQSAEAVPDTIADKRATVKPVASDSSIAKAGKTDSVAAAKKKSKSKNEKAINIGLTAGVDYSTVKFTNGSNAGYNIGLMGGYQFSKHWSVYTGLVYTKKNYDLNGKDYHPPQHYFTYYVDLQKVEGYCRMWEIPLLARYTFNPGAKTAFFASTGLSSYFMKKQAYDYTYKNGMSQQMTGAWATDSTFTHAFSVLHLSGGFEKHIGKYMNWQIEPYAKIPLGGLGFGNIRLSSFGVNFSVQYRHPVRR